MKDRKPDSCRQNWYFDTALDLSTKIYPIFGVLVGCHCIFYPEWECYPTSLPFPWPLNWFVRITYPPQYIFCIVASWELFLFCFLLFIVNGMYVWTLLSEFTCNSRKRPSDYLTLTSFREMHTIRSYYTQLQLLNICFLDFWAVLILPLTSLLSNLVLFSNYSLIRQWHQMDKTNACVLIIWALAGTLSVCVSFEIFGELRNKGVKALSSMGKRDWGSNARNREMKKFVKGCQPISYGYGKVIVLKTSSVLGYVKGATRGTFRTLLAF